jgi:hypothetical protein
MKAVTACAHSTSPLLVRLSFRVQIGKSVAREDFFRGDFSVTRKDSLNSEGVRPVEDLVERTPLGPIYALESFEILPRISGDAEGKVLRCQDTPDGHVTNWQGEYLGGDTATEGQGATQG